MRDTSRPHLPKNNTSSRAYNPIPSPSLGGRVPLRRDLVERLNSDNYSESPASESESSSTYQYPWGMFRARAGRGDLVQQGRTNCTAREIALSLHLIAAAWASGQLGLEWLLWPEEDNAMCGEAIIECWGMVQQQQEADEFESHELEEIIARKVPTLSIHHKFSLALISFRCAIILAKGAQCF
jgi:hypothetical protein